MKKMILSVFSLCLVFASMGQDSSKLVSVLQGKFSIKLPPGLQELSAETIQLKYHKTKAADEYFYGNADVSFSAVITSDGAGVTEKSLVAHKDQLAGQFSAKGYKLDENKIIKVNGHDCLLISFNIEVPDAKILNKRYFFAAAGKLLTLNFNTTETDLAKRIQQMDAAVQTIHIK